MESKSEKEEESPRDTLWRKMSRCHYGHLIVVLSFLAHVIIYGVCWTVGMWSSILREEFHGSHSQASTLGAILNGVMYLCGKHYCNVDKLKVPQIELLGQTENR